MEQGNKTIIVAGIVALIIIIGSLIYAGRISNGPSKYDDFAKCLGTNGATFYGAFWCSHCQNQKALFGSAKKYLPYVECSTPDAKGMLPICIAQEIKNFPTWVFPDLSTTTGEISLAILSDKTGCVLPQ